MKREVLTRLRHLTTNRPDRTTHLAIDIAQHGAPLSIPAVQVALEQLWADHQVVHTGRGWRLPDSDGVQLEIDG